MNLLKKWRERCERKRKEREAQQTIQLWVWLEKIFESGQLSYDYEHHRLYITQPMAVMMMAHGADGWVCSVRNIYEYAHWLQTQKAWEDYMRKEELAAVREALSGPQGDKVTREDIQRIKQTRRAEIALSDMEPLKMEQFEFFIIPDSKQAKVEPLAVGYYDPGSGKMEVAAWDEVKLMLKTG